MLATRLRAVGGGGGGGGGWTPIDVSPTLWLDLSDSSARDVVSDHVETLYDKSGNGRDFHQPNASMRPELISGAIGGLDAAYFDTGKIMESVTSWSTGNDHTLIAVVDIINTGTRRYIIVSGEDSSGINYRLLMFATGNNSGFVGYFDGLGWRSGGTQSTGGQILGWELDSNNSSGATYRDGSTLASGIIYSPNYIRSTTPVQLGARDGAATNWNDAVIGELIMTDTVLSNSDREKVEGYLAHKWGLSGSLTPSHPYKLAPPV